MDSTIRHCTNESNWFFRRSLILTLLIKGLPKWCQTNESFFSLKYYLGLTGHSKFDLVLKKSYAVIIQCETQRVSFTILTDYIRLHKISRWILLNLWNPLKFNVFCPKFFQFIESIPKILFCKLYSAILNYLMKNVLKPQGQKRVRGSEIWRLRWMSQVSSNPLTLEDEMYINLFRRNCFRFFCWRATGLKPLLPLLVD